MVLELKHQNSSRRHGNALTHARALRASSNQRSYISTAIVFFETLDKGGKLVGMVEKGLRKIGITVSKPILAIICIISGILVIVFEELLQWIVGLFLIIQGILLLTEYLELKRK